MATEKEKKPPKDKLIQDNTEFFLTTDNHFRVLMKHIGGHKKYKMLEWQRKRWKEMLYSLDRLRKRAQNSEDLVEED